MPLSHPFPQVRNVPVYLREFCLYFLLYLRLHQLILFFPLNLGLQYSCVRELVVWNMLLPIVIVLNLSCFLPLTVKKICVKAFINFFTSFFIHLNLGINQIYNKSLLFPYPHKHPTNSLI